MDIQVGQDRVASSHAGVAAEQDGFFDGSAALGARRFWTLCALVGALALLVRVPRLASRSLWLDEAYSAWFSNRALHELWSRVPLYETHPPFYYTLLKGWQALFGQGEAALRSLSVLASVATVLLLAVAPRAARLGPPAQRVGLLGALFLALNAGSVQFGEEARPYALQAFTAAIAICCSFMLLEQARTRGWPQWRWIGGLALAAGLTLWLHNTGMFVALGIWSGLLSAAWLLPAQRRRGALLGSSVAGALALLVWLPFLPTFLAQRAGMATLDFWVRFKPGDLPSAWVLAGGGRPLKIVAALLAFAGLAFLSRRRRAAAWHMAAVLAVAPLAMAAYSYFVKPIFLPRLFEWLAPPMAILLALGVFALRPAWRKPAVALVIALSVYALQAFYARPTENWREMLAQLAADARPGDLVLAIPNEVQVPVSYYLKPGELRASIVYLPGAFPALGMRRRYVGNLGAPAVDGADVERVRAMLPGHRRVWLIERRMDLYDPRRAVRGLVSARGRAVEVIDGRGATITLFEMTQAPTRRSRPRGNDVHLMRQGW
jgi:uncharacterized membrane protein